jgi:hypothetical protein
MVSEGRLFRCVKGSGSGSSLVGMSSAGLDQMDFSAHDGSHERPTMVGLLGCKLRDYRHSAAEVCSTRSREIALSLTPASRFLREYSIAHHSA